MTEGFLDMETKFDTLEEVMAKADQTSGDGGGQVVGTGNDTNTTPKEEKTTPTVKTDSENKSDVFIQPSVIDERFKSLEEVAKGEQEENRKESNYEKESDGQVVTEEEDEQRRQEAQEPREWTDDEIKEYFNDAREFGLFDLPEDFEFDGSEEKFEEARDLTIKAFEERAEQSLQDRISDPVLREIVDHGLKGGSFADLETFARATKQEYDFAGFDLSSEEAQMQMLTYFHQQTSRLNDSQIKFLVEESQDKGTLASDAENSRKFFVDAAKEAKAKEIHEARKKEADRRAEAEAYSREFKEALSQTKYPKQTKDAILAAFDTQELGGKKQMRFHHQLAKVQENPAHMITLLNILQGYDPKKGFSFSEIESAKETEAEKKLFNKFKKKGSSATNKSSRPPQETGRKPFFPSRNPLDANISTI